MKQRSDRNRLARVLMEGYDETPHWHRFMLLSAEMAIAELISIGWTRP